MAKINLDKLNSFEPIKPERQTEVKGSQTAPIRPPHTETAGAKDRVDFSGKAAEVGKFVGKVKDLPDVRMEKVEDAKAQIKAGTFDPSSDAIAQAIMVDETQ